MYSVYIYFFYGTNIETFKNLEASNHTDESVKCTQVIVITIFIQDRVGIANVGMKGVDFNLRCD